MITVFRCEYCYFTCRDAARMAEHEKNCGRNPATRGCHTCALQEGSHARGGYEEDNFFCTGGHKEDHTAEVSECPFWVNAGEDAL